RVIALSVTLMLLALSLVLPVLSQGGAADLATAVTALEFDWFYLGGLALLYRWSPDRVWLLTGALTALLVVIPWLPLRRRGAQRRFQLTIHPGPGHASARAGETILEAGL